MKWFDDAFGRALDEPAGRQHRCNNPDEADAGPEQHQLPQKVVTEHHRDDGDADERVVSAGLIRDADDDDDEGDAAGDEDNPAENADENPVDSGAENPDVASDDSPSGDEA